MNNQRAVLVIVFFFIFTIIAVVLQKVDLPNSGQNSPRLELKEISFTGYSGNNSIYTISAKSANSNNNTDYTRLFDVVCEFTNSDFKVYSTQSTLGLYSIFLTKGVTANLGQDITLTSKSLNYNIRSGMVSLREKSKITINKDLHLLLRKGEYAVSQNIFTIEHLEIANRDFTASSKQGLYHVPDKKLLLTENIAANFQTEKTSLKFTAENLIYNVDSGNFKLEKNIKVTLKEKSAFAQKGFYNKETKILTLIDKSYIVDSTGRLNAEKILINTVTNEMEAFEGVQAIINVRN